MGCSFIELNEHPDKFNLMAQAFTLQKAWNDAEEIWKAQSEAKAKLDA